jgi:hypothetical protein
MTGDDTMNEIETAARKVQEAKDALSAANQTHADAKRRAREGKHVSDLSPAELKVESRRLGLRNR